MQIISMKSEKRGKFGQALIFAVIFAMLALSVSVGYASAESSFITDTKINDDDPQGWNSATCARIDYCMKTFSILIGDLKKVKIDRIFPDFKEIYPFAQNGNIYGLTLSGSIQLYGDTSLIRVILVDNNFNEYLVYEAYPLIVTRNSFSVTNVCEETCLLDSITPYSLKVEVIDASVHIDELSYTDSLEREIIDIAELQKQIKETQNAVKIKEINNQIKKKGLKWIAGETSVSRLFYEEKKKLFSRDKVPNLQGAEYYKGGILEIKSGDTSPSLPTDGGSSTLIESFDWRNRHGANNPDSPYYDGDPNGSGWITPVKTQGCAHCWAFTPLHATEAIVNLYFNQHLDLDLSEQDVASCSGGNIGCCQGGYIGTALNYIINTGVVDEECFPYSASCESCANKCSNPDEQIKISGRLYPGYDEEDIKRAIIDYGPITGGISSWWHFMVMVGFDKDPDDGETIWIFKNSWGTGWGDNGYGYLKVELNDLYGKYALLTPVTSLETPYEIACYDKDGDGYYNWGISENKPPSCPGGCPAEKDCDDSNPHLGPFDANGYCTELSIEKAIIAVVNPDTYRILKMGALNDSGNFYSIANGSIADGKDFTDPADWTGVGEQQDFISTILTNAGYEVDQFEASVLPSISNADYQVVIVQDPLRTNVRSFSKESEHNLPDLLEYTTDATFLAKLEAYFDSGGQVIFVGDAVRLLEDGPGRLNWGKSVIDRSVFNNPSQDNPRLADHWLFIRGNPFCGIDRNGSGQYLVHLSTLVNSGTVLSDITLFNGNDLPWSSCWSDTFYYPEDGTSLLSVDVTGTGEYVLSGATCNPPVYNDTVNETLLHLIGYTHHNGKKVFYIGSDSFFDYHYVNHEGAWHVGEYHSIQCSVTEAGKEAIVRLVQNATERKAKDELAVDFKTLGIYVYNTGIWKRIYQGIDPEGLCSFGTYLAVDFGSTYGLYVYDAGAWTRVYKGVAIEKMAGFGGKLAVDFGTSYPLYEYNFATDTWNAIYEYSSPRDKIEALGDKLVVDFKTAGIYVYDAGIWNRIYKGVDPVNIVSFGDKLAIDFGTAYGLYVYEYDTDNWTKVYKGVAIEKMSEIDGDLAVDFGTAYGLYVYEFDTDNWNRVYKGVAIEKMAGFDGKLAVDFGTTYPIYEYDFDTNNWNSIYKYSSPRDELAPANIFD